jgi:hypothetical protein
LGQPFSVVPARRARTPNTRIREDEKPCLEDWGMVPVERIELPTFGLQNRCSTAELNRRIEAIGARRKCPPLGPIFGGSNIRLGRKGPEPLEPVSSLPYGKRRPFQPPFPSAIRRPSYWQRCRRPSSPRNQVPGTQTKPLRRAYSSPPIGEVAMAAAVPAATSPGRKPLLSSKRL